MKVIKSEEDKLVFDNGLIITGSHSQDCCEHNYLDFEQLPVGTELSDMDAADFYKAIHIKEDGFTIKDSMGVPKWVQARSDQNGYYSDGVDMVITYKDQKLVPRNPNKEDYDGLFAGKQQYA